MAIKRKFSLIQLMLRVIQMLSGGVPVDIRHQNIRNNELWQLPGTDKDIADISFVNYGSDVCIINGAWIVEPGDTIFIFFNIGERCVTNFEFVFTLNNAETPRNVLITYKKYLG